MSEKKRIKILFVLCVVTLVLPWFTYSARMMGYCWGAEFYAFFLLPMLLIGHSLFGRGTEAPRNVLGVFGCVGDIGALIYAVGIWQERHNIRGGFFFMDGVRTATVCFWITAALHLLLFAAVSVSALKDLTKKGGA